MLFDPCLLTDQIKVTTRLHGDHSRPPSVHFDDGAANLPRFLRGLHAWTMVNLVGLYTPFKGDDRDDHQSSFVGSFLFTHEDVPGMAITMFHVLTMPHITLLISMYRF